MMAEQTHRVCRRVLQRHAEVVYCGGGRVEGMGETAQQVANLVGHVTQGDRSS